MSLGLGTLCHTDIVGLGCSNPEDTKMLLRGFRVRHVWDSMRHGFLRTSFGILCIAQYGLWPGAV